MDIFWNDEQMYEPSDADEILSEAAGKLYEAITDRVKTRIEAVEEDNARLKKRVAELLGRENDIHKREAELKKAKEDFGRNIKKMTIEQFLKGFEVQMWRAKKVKQSLKPKCNLCDSNRLLHFRSPLGREMTENCKCAEQIYLYKPVEVILSEFESSRKGLHVWYKLNGTGRVYADLSELYDGVTSYAELNSRKAVFKTKEGAQKYCDALNRGH